MKFSGKHAAGPGLGDRRGVHTGKAATVTIGPADANSGYVFVRSGLEGPDRELKAVRTP